MFISPSLALECGWNLLFLIQKLDPRGRAAIYGRVGTIADVNAALKGPLFHSELQIPRT